MHAYTSTLHRSPQHVATIHASPEDFPRDLERAIIRRKELSFRLANWTTNFTVVYMNANIVFSGARPSSPGAVGCQGTQQPTYIMFVFVSSRAKINQRPLLLLHNPFPRVAIRYRVLTLNSVGVIKSVFAWRARGSSSEGGSVKKQKRLR